MLAICTNEQGQPKWTGPVTRARKSAQPVYMQHASIFRQQAAKSPQQVLEANAKTEADIRIAPADNFKSEFFILVSKKLKKICLEEQKSSIWRSPDLRNGTGGSPVVAKKGEGHPVREIRHTLLGKECCWCCAGLTHQHVGTARHVLAQSFTTIGRHWKLPCTCADTKRP